MITRTHYSFDDLESGECQSCSEESEEILINDGRCLDCIEEQKFFEETMKGLPCNNCQGGGCPVCCGSGMLSY